MHEAPAKTLPREDVLTAVMYSSKVSEEKKKTRNFQSATVQRTDLGAMNTDNG
jgi:hypothetical protein